MIAGMKVIICGAGMSGHLAGGGRRPHGRCRSSAFRSPPIRDGRRDALVVDRADAHAACRSRPSAIDGAMNAAVLAAQIIGVRDEEVRRGSGEFKDDLAEGLRL